MSKISVLSKVIKDTEVIEGGSLSFKYYFVMTHLLNAVKRHVPFLRSWCVDIAKSNTKRFIIKNKTGVFYVRPFNDSFTISADYFEEDLRKWVGLPSDKNLFLDIGSNIGRYALIAKNNFSYKKVVCIEANPVTFEILNKNIKLNNIENDVKCLSVAVGDYEGKIKFQSDSSHLGGGKVMLTDDSETGWDNVVEVNVKTVDSILQNENISHSDISFIKMDVEGYEINALNGMRETLAGVSNGTFLMLEISDDNTSLVGWLSEIGFVLSEKQNNDYLFIKS